MPLQFQHFGTQPAGSFINDSDFLVGLKDGKAVKVSAEVIKQYLGTPGFYPGEMLQVQQTVVRDTPTRMGTGTTPVWTPIPGLYKTIKCLSDKPDVRIEANIACGSNTAGSQAMFRIVKFYEPANKVYGGAWSDTLKFATASAGRGRVCSARVKETKTLDIPEYVSLPVTADVTWEVDDDFQVNGVRLNPNGCEANKGKRKIILDKRKITVDLIDTVGVWQGGEITFEIPDQGYKIKPEIVGVGRLEPGKLDQSAITASGDSRGYGPVNVPQIVRIDFLDENRNNKVIKGSEITYGIEWYVFGTNAQIALNKALINGDANKPSDARAISTLVITEYTNDL